jgi:hypothetical protein
VGPWPPPRSFGPPRPGAQRGGIGEGGGGQILWRQGDSARLRRSRRPREVPPARGVNEEGASRAGGLARDSGDGPSPASRLMFKRWAPSSVFRLTWC